MTIGSQSKFLVSSIIGHTLIASIVLFSNSNTTQPLINSTSTNIQIKITKNSPIKSKPIKKIFTVEPLAPLVSLTKKVNHKDKTKEISKPEITKTKKNPIRKKLVKIPKKITKIVNAKIKASKKLTKTIKKNSYTPHYDTSSLKKLIEKSYNKNTEIKKESKSKLTTQVKKTDISNNSNITNKIKANHIINNVTFSLPTLRPSRIPNKISDGTGDDTKELNNSNAKNNKLNTYSKKEARQRTKSIKNSSKTTLTRTKVAKLSKDEITWLIKQFTKCWSPPAALMKHPEVQIKVAVKLNRNGQIIDEPKTINNSNHKLFKLASKSAIQAVFKCAPYILPPAKYDRWKSMIINFNVAGMET